MTGKTAETALTTTAPLEIAEAGSFAAAPAETNGRWRVRAIRAGMSANGVFYPEAALREALRPASA